MLPINIEQATRGHEHYYRPEKIPSDSSYLPDPSLSAVAVSCVDRVSFPAAPRTMAPTDAPENRVSKLSSSAGRARCRGKLTVQALEVMHSWSLVYTASTSAAIL
jgi:hypothetical protein